jgi:hypothetical protein
MELIFALAALVAVLVGFDAAAITYGVDSRDQLPDSHRR